MKITDIDGKTHDLPEGTYYMPVLGELAGRVVIYCKNNAPGCDGQTGSVCDRCRIEALEERLAQIESNMHPTGELFKDFAEQTNKRLASLERKVWGLAENESVDYSVYGKAYDKGLVALLKNSDSADD